MKPSTIRKSLPRRLTFLFVTGLAILFAASFALADVGNDLEKPKPVFTAEKDGITAKLIPRGKSTSVLLQFKAAGGKLAEVKGVDFEKYETPDVDVKNFKSALFEVQVEDVPVGGEAKISVISDFFTSSTAFYIHGPKAEKPWFNPPTDPPVANISHPNLVQELVIPVKDGGVYDHDGVANGQVLLVGGPRDSFWGYALGTLFIRFFGIFIVLGILMLGMLISGRIFMGFSKEEASAPRGKAIPSSPAEPRPVAEDTPPEIVAAIATALAVSEPTPEIAAAIATAISAELAAANKK